jgi:hypothetical protein
MINKNILMRYIINEAVESRSYWRDKIQSYQNDEYQLAIANMDGHKKARGQSPNLNGTEHEDFALNALRAYYGDDISLISFDMSFLYPDRYFFYRSAPFDEYIIDGLKYCMDALNLKTEDSGKPADTQSPHEISQKHINFDKVSKNNIDRYLEVNKVLNEVSKLLQDLYPEDLNSPLELQAAICCFLYQSIADLFIKPESEQRYWFMVCRGEAKEGDESNWDLLNDCQSIKWSGRVGMNVGDMVLMYRTAPRKAVTEIYQVVSPIEVDPWLGWDAVWVDLEKITSVPDIPFSLIRKDPILSQWGRVKGQFQGSMTDPLPARFYNRFLDLIPLSIRESNGLIQDKSSFADSLTGGFSSEWEFENEVVIPFLKTAQLQFHRQYHCDFQVGSQVTTGKIDFLVKPTANTAFVIESKLKILSDKQLKNAVNQAKSYALLSGTPCFAIASPEGLWIYSLIRNNESLECRSAWKDLQIDHTPTVELIKRLSQ